MKLGIIGVTGRMGKKILKSILDNPSLSVGFGSASPHSPHLGSDLGSLIDSPPLKIYVENTSLASFQKADLLIDFSLANATSGNIQKALDYKKPLLIGTTGLLEETKKLLEEAKKHIPILMASNFSFGIQLCIDIAKKLSQTLKEKAHIEIVETHHRNKKDAPSGSALALAEAMQLDTSHNPIRSLRVDNVIGEHTITFNVGNERITLTHTALSRDVFTEGALRAAQFLITQPPGLYTLQDLFSQKFSTR